MFGIIDVREQLMYIPLKILEFLCQEKKNSQINDVIV